MTEGHDLTRRNFGKVTGALAFASAPVATDETSGRVPTPEEPAGTTRDAAATAGASDDYGEQRYGAGGYGGSA